MKPHSAAGVPSLSLFGSSSATGPALPGSASSNSPRPEAASSDAQPTPAAPHSALEDVRAALGKVSPSGGGKAPIQTGKFVLPNGVSTVEDWLLSVNYRLFLLRTLNISDFVSLQVG